MAKSLEEETAPVEQVVEEKIAVEEPVVIDGFVLDRTSPPEIALPKWALQSQMGYQMHKDLRSLGWKLIGSSCDSRERGLVYMAPYLWADGITKGMAIRVSWRRN